MNKTRGFTLLEIILTLVLLGVLGTMLGPLLLGPVAGSAKPLANLGDEVGLQSWMEKIVATANAHPSDLAVVKSYVAANAPGHYTVVANAYCVLDGTAFVADPGLATGQLLRVTIKSATTGETLTVLFAGHGS